MKILSGNIMKTLYELKKFRRYKAVYLNSIYEGTMIKLYPNPDVVKMRNVTLYGIPNRKYEFSFFSKQFKFYDIQEIRDKARKARESMEHRALLIILRKLINDFIW